MKKIFGKSAKSLRHELIRSEVIPVLVMAIAVVYVSIYSFYGSLSEQIKSDLENQCNLVMKIYDSKYPGEYSLKKNETGLYRVYKGNSDITDDTSIIDAIKNSYSIDMSLFCQNIRMVTTFEDANGNRYISTNAATVVTEDMKKDRKGKFYNNVTVENDKYLAYYEPIFLEDGTYFGMIGVCRSASDTRKYVIHAIIPVIIVYIAAAIVIILIMLYSLRKIIYKIENLKSFMKSVSDADFTRSIDESVLNSDDEIGELAKMSRKMQNSIKMLVEYDALTKLNNRRFGDDKLVQMKKYSEETGEPYCISIGDIDFFKKVNDTYGHEAGDEVLKTVALILKKNLAGKGYAVRWGGEEFLLLFKNMKKDDALIILTGVLNQIRNTKIEYKGTIISVTMSFGLTQADNEISIDKNLTNADMLLYDAKENGRNQIVS